MLLPSTVRGLLVVIVIPCLAGCITTVQRRRGPERPIATRCVPELVRVTLAPLGDQVQLQFDRLESCTSDYEEIWIEETETQLATPVQVTLTVVAAAAVMTPLFVVRAVERPNPPPPPTPYSGPTFVDWVKTVGTFAAGAAAGLVVGLASTLQLKGSTVAKPERSTRPSVESEVVVLKGTFAAVAITPRPLIDGKLDLSLEEGLALEAGGLTLDGARVEITIADKARLAGLALCRQALEAIEAQTVIEEKLTQAFGCRRAGWAFADPVIGKLSGITH